MSIETQTKTAWDIYLEVCAAMGQCQPVPKTKYVPREEYDSVLYQLISYQKGMENKVEEYGRDRFDLCQKIEDQAKEICRLKKTLNQQESGGKQP
jgi:predicted RNase H-like nuclease (RuvC/YqgF family)